MKAPIRKLAMAIVASVAAGFCANADMEYIEIRTVNDLKGITATTDYNTKSYKLMADIDMRYESWRIGGTFTGVFDGNGHTISNIYCVNPWDPSGFFEALGDGAIVRNLSLRGGEVRTNNGYIGGLAGTVSGTVLVEDCTIDVLVSSGSGYVGGFVGYVYSDATLTLRRCRSLSAVVGRGDCVGGLVGQTYYQTTIVNVESCYVAGSVKGSGWVGGIVGSPSNSSPSLFTISNSYSVAELTGISSSDKMVGALHDRVVIIDTPTILDCFPKNKINVRMRGTSTNSGTSHGMASYDAETGEFTATPSAGSAFYGWEGLPPKEGEYNELTVWAVFGLPVATVKDFKDMDANGIYVQTADIDLEETKGYNYWTFNGCYNGGGHEIRNLKRENDGNYGGTLLGMFEQMGGAVVKNLRIVNPSVVGDGGSIGALAGKATKSTFINVRVEGASVKGGGSSIGGLVGEAGTCTMENCSSSAEVTGYDDVGGLVGSGANVTVRESYADGSVIGHQYAGGLVGCGNSRSYVHIYDSYALGTVFATNGVAGGLVGETNWIWEGDGIGVNVISNCFSAGAVSAESGSLGGFDGNDETCTKSGCYWDTEASGCATTYGTGVTGLTTAQMQSGTAFAGWDTDVWKFVEGQYPRLRAFIPKYTVTWLDGDGTTVLKEEIVDEGDTPTCEAPAKGEDTYNTYSFLEWMPAVAPVTSDATYTATYMMRPKWTGQGTVYEPYTLTTAARIAEILALDEGSTPEIYVNVGGDITAAAITDNLLPGYAVRTTDTAGVVKVVQVTTIVWYDEDGTTVLERDEDVAIGTMPSYDGATPTKASTTQYDYAFAGWTPEIVEVTESASYTATYTPTLRSYTITWLDADGTQIDTTTVDYGETPVHPRPVSVYTFTGWDPDITFVTGPETYTAKYIQEVVLDNLTADFTAADGDVLTGSTTYNVSIPGGATVTINGVSVTGAGGGVVPAAPSFSGGGETATTKFVKEVDGKWRIVAFAELSNDSVGAEVPENKIKVYAAESIDELKNAEPMSDGVEIKARKSAVMTTIEVTPPAGKDKQFFKVKFGE